jgi:hypothetical protein
MKPTLQVGACALLVVVLGHAQQDWSTPIAITRDSINEQYVTFANSKIYGFGGNSPEDCMAFVRHGRDICVKQTQSHGAQWSDSMYCVPNDSAQFGRPTLTFTRLPGSSTSGLVLVWESNEYPLPNSNLMYTTRSNEIWNQPALITTQGAGDHNPYVAPFDSGVGVVWQRNGRIMYSRYVAGAWSPPEYVTATNDTLNCNPKLHYQQNFPVVLWLKRKAPDTTFSLYTSTKRASGWRQPDTIAFSGDNRQAAFFKPNFAGSMFAICWTRAIGSGWEVVATSGNYTFDTLQRGVIERLSTLQRLGRNVSPSANWSPIPITASNPTTVWHTVSAWHQSALEGNGIAATRWAGSSYRLFTGSNASTYRNPEVSIGAFSFPYLRIWVVWEGMESNKWKLYGANTLFTLTSVEGQDVTPKEPTLYQNYPNPFNPSTTIRFEVAGSGFVSLKVFDVLGREVATLVNEERMPGRYERVFQAEGLPSGLYVYQLKTHKNVATRKLLLLK